MISPEVCSLEVEVLGGDGDMAARSNFGDDCLKCSGAETSEACSLSLDFLQRVELLLHQTPVLDEGGEEGTCNKSKKLVGECEQRAE